MSIDKIELVPKFCDVLMLIKKVSFLLPFLELNGKSRTFLSTC